MKRDRRTNLHQAHEVVLQYAVSSVRGDLIGLIISSALIIGACVIAGALLI